MSPLKLLQQRGLAILRMFHPRKECFLEWINDFELAIVTLNIPDEDKVPFLLIMIEPSVYEQLRSAVDPFNPFELSMKVLTHQLEVMYLNNEGYSAARN